MLQPLRRAAVRVVKPRVSDETWAKLRAIDPRRSRKRPGSMAANVASEDPVDRTPRTGLARLHTSLGNLAANYGAERWGKRNYARHYEQHFKIVRRTRFTLLKIGIGGYRLEDSGGNTLRMWKHFFPKAQIVGLDLEDKSFINEKRILTYQGSQTDAYLLRSIAKKHRNLKIIVDDGSHGPEHIRATFAVLFPLLSDGGFYAIEDTQTSYWPRFGGRADPKDPATTMGMVKDLLDGLNYEEFGDQRPRFYTDSHVVAVHCYHNLVIIKKGLNAEGGHRPKDWATPREADGAEP
jgi:hypothetical protein